MRNAKVVPPLSEQEAYDFFKSFCRNREFPLARLEETYNVLLKYHKKWEAERKSGEQGKQRYLAYHNMQNGLLRLIREISTKEYASLIEDFERKRIERVRPVGDWIVAIEVVGGGTAKHCKIYNAKTGREHYKYFGNLSVCSEDADPAIKDFYSRAENERFLATCDMANAW